MPDPWAELSSVATNLDEMAIRIASLAESGGPEDTMTVDLYEIERSLRGAQRRLAKLLETRSRGRA